MSSPSARKLLVFSALLSWEDAVFMLRISGPWQAAGWTLERGNVNDPAASDFSQADAVMIHRDFAAYTTNYKTIIQLCTLAGKPLIYEADDLLIEPPANHIGQLFFARGKAAILETISMADAVVVSTEHLQQHLKAWNGNVHVVKNYLHDQVWPLYSPSVDAENEVVTIGYCGQTSHREDIDLLAPALKLLLTTYGQKIKLKFFAIAPPEDLRARPGVEWKPLTVQSYPMFSQVMAQQQCDIFLAPLADSSFNRCKSTIKFLEHAALGKPAVYSNLPPYCETVENEKTGLLASTDEDWVRQLSRLIDSAELRLHIAEESQSYVKSNLLLSQNTDVLVRKYDEIFASAVISMQDLYARSTTVPELT
jgi:glycosyltransferase involved in cell wall biosynthesis